jgi:hypothetical protein
MYFFRYSCGVSPVMRLKIVRKVFISLYPALCIIERMLRSPLSISLFPDSILTRCKYSSGLLLVAFLNRLIKFRLLIFACAAICSNRDFLIIFFFNESLCLQYLRIVMVSLSLEYCKMGLSNSIHVNRKFLTQLKGDFPATKLFNEV